MNVGTNLLGRLRNTSLPYTQGLLPVFEAVVNAFHAIEEAGLSSDEGRVEISIQRAPTLLADADAASKKGRNPNGDILSFSISDNGVGFTDANFAAFLTLDTEHKAAKGGRGIGRLMWLKAFEKAEIASWYRETVTELRLRRFSFNGAGVDATPTEPVVDERSPGTIVTLLGFDSKYRAQTKKTGDAIAKAILEHCLWYFLRAGGAPQIVLVDDGESIDLNQLFDQYMHSSAVHEAVTVKMTPFELLHVKLRVHVTSGTLDRILRR